MQLYAGLDLHSRNTYIGIKDKEFKRVFGKRVSNNLPLILKTWFIRLKRTLFHAVREFSV
jgi:hypothetical protein